MTVLISGANVNIDTHNGWNRFSWNAVTHKGTIVDIIATNSDKLNTQDMKNGDTALYVRGTAAKNVLLPRLSRDGPPSFYCDCK